MITNANSVQVGGTHYKTRYEHWDFVIRALHGRYLEGNVTKYVSRWRKKNGLEDLKKAQHYIAKLIEEVQANRVVSFFSEAHYRTAYEETMSFCVANELDGREREVMLRCATWYRVQHLSIVSEHIAELIKEAQKLRNEEEAQKVRRPFGSMEPGPSVTDLVTGLAVPKVPSLGNDAPQQSGEEPGAGYVDQ